MSTRHRRSDTDAPPTGGIERRGCPRVLVDLEVDCRCRDNFLFASIRDISATGIFVQTQHPEPPGTHLNLRFTPDDSDEPFELEGRVIWINRYRPGDATNLNPGMGVRFVALTDAQRRRLSELVRTFAYLDDDDDAD